MNIHSKLPDVGTTIFTVMSRLANEHGAINLSQGFPNFDCSDQLKQLVTDYMNKGFNQYAPLGGVLSLREALADKVKKLYGLSVNPTDEITITAGATQAIFTAIAAFVQAGDEVVIIEPAYDCYRPTIELFGGIPVVYELKGPDYRIDWQEFENCLSPKTRMIIINTPHNPSGKVFRAEDFETLDRITVGTDILLLSDEVYEHLVYDDGWHESVLRYPRLFSRSIATYSFGKTFHNTGWKMGYCVGAAPLMDEFRKVHQFNVFCVNSPMQYAIADYLSNPEVYLELSPLFQEKRNFFLEKISGSRFRPVACEGTYFQLVDYSAISEEKDTDFAKRLTMEHGVASIPVSVFYSSGRDEKVIRFCFAKTEDLLTEAGERLCRV